MKMSIICSASLLFFAAIFCGAGRAQEPPHKILAMKAEEICAATVKCDFARVADLTYPKVIAAMGGRDKMIAELSEGIARMKAQGFSPLSTKLGKASELFIEGENTFAVVPTENEMTAPGGKLVGKSYLLGISPDRGKTWRFIEGTGLNDREARRDVLPPLPAKLELPQAGRPEFIPAK